MAMATAARRRSGQPSTAAAPQEAKEELTGRLLDEFYLQLVETEEGARLPGTARVIGDRHSKRNLALTSPRPVWAWRAWNPVALRSAERLANLAKGAQLPNLTSSDTDYAEWATMTMATGFVTSSEKLDGHHDDRFTKSPLNQGDAATTGNASPSTARSPALTSPQRRAWNLVARGMGLLAPRGGNLEDATKTDVLTERGTTMMTCTDHDMVIVLLTMGAMDGDLRRYGAAGATATTDLRPPRSGADWTTLHCRRELRSPALTSPNGRAWTLVAHVG